MLGGWYCFAWPGPSPMWTFLFPAEEGNIERERERERERETRLPKNPAAVPPHCRLTAASQPPHRHRLYPVFLPPYIARACLRCLASPFLPPRRTGEEPRTPAATAAAPNLEMSARDRAGDGRGRRAIPGPLPGTVGGGRSCGTARSGGPSSKHPASGSASCPPWSWRAASPSRWREDSPWPTSRGA